MQNNHQDIESILESGGSAALKEFIEKSANHLRDLAEREDFHNLKDDLLYRKRTVDWLKAKASAEQEATFLVGYYCGILSVYEGTLKKHFQEETDCQICHTLNALDTPNLKNIMQVISNHPGISYRRLSKISGIDITELFDYIEPLAQNQAIIVNRPFYTCYFSATPAGLKYAGILSDPQ